MLKKKKEEYHGDTEITENHGEDQKKQLWLLALLEYKKIKKR
jgi:hypothetical protein